MILGQVSNLEIQFALFRLSRLLRTETLSSRDYTNTTQRDYDVLDHLTQVTDSANNVTTMTYNWLGRKTAMSDPDMGTWSYRYDRNGNLTEQTDAKGQRTCFYYDALNRLKGKNYQSNATQCPSDPGTYTVTYRYDEGTNAFNQTQKGFRTSMSDASGSASWQYDMLGRVLKESKTITGAPANPYITEYTYNTLNQVLTMKYPDNEIVSASYNAQNLPQSLSGTNGYITNASYNASDQITNLAFQSGTTTTYTYDPNMLRLTALVTSGNIQNLSYGYDKVGNVTTITDTVRSEVASFTYDDLNRLRSASIPNVYAHSWTYSPIGNMLTRNDNNGNVSYQYNDAAHKHAVTQVGSNYFCYDQNGNMTRRNASNANCTSGEDTLNYDVENRLTSTTVANVTTNYFYNGDGARVKKEVNGVKTYYVGNLYEYTTWTGGSSISKYYYFGAQRIAVKQDINISYLHGDHLGSTNKTTGASSSTQTYYPYGAIRTSSGTVPTDYGFTGQKRDATANLMYYGARYYDPALARFIQPDTLVPNPMDPQSLNRYSYVRNNPVNLVDPTGHEDCAPEDDWCWQNRWYEAHGYCWSDAKQDWSKSCQPEFQDEGILKEVLGENGGLNIVMQANMLKVFAMLMQQIQQSISNVPPPNFLIIGVQVSGNLTPLYGEGSLQIVFDFQHLEVGWFVSGGFGGGGSSGAGFSTNEMLHLFGSASASIQIGVGWCVAPGCAGVSNYAGWMQEFTVSASTLT